MKSIILDCYTDEPSGYGVPPYLGTHQIHLSQALNKFNVEHSYLTIDDLRYNEESSTDKSTANTTINKIKSKELISNAEIIYIVMGCFIDYEYFNALPPKSDEVYEFLKDTKAKKVLFYVMGTKEGISEEYKNSKLSTIIDEFTHGNTYRFIADYFSIKKNAINEGCDENLIAPDYLLLSEISSAKVSIEFENDIIAEIETGTGCNTPFCKFCIESVRSPKVTYRTPSSIIDQVQTLYAAGVRYFRLGRQPNFFHYAKQDVVKLEELLYGIRASCPDIKMLHIDNANIVNVISQKGIEFTKLICKYCTSGNISPFGIESFDNNVRKLNGVVGTSNQVLKAIEIINRFGNERDETGYHKLLPGINLIHGLIGETQETHDLNMKFLEIIQSEGFLTRRLYYRSMTRPTGVSFEDGPLRDNDYETNFNDIVENYVLPMQEKVYPKGIVLSGQKEVSKTKSGYSCRAFGTCPIKINLIGNVDIEQLNSEFKVEVTNNVLSYRRLEGKIVKETT